MVKVSNYYMDLPLRDDACRHLLLHSYYGTHAIVSESVAQSLEEARREIRRVHMPDEQTLQILRDARCLLPCEVDEDADFARTCARVQEDASRHISVTWVPSYACNFRCPYCFERELHQPHSTWHKTRMSIKLAQAIFEALDKQLAAGKRMASFTLFGGEPLLPQNREIVTYILTRCKQYEVPISVVTNGYYLGEYLPLLKDCAVAALKITIDGTKDVHDQRRAPQNGRSFDRIMRHVRAALELGMTVSLRTNVNRENFGMIEALSAYYREIGLTQFPTFSYYFKATMACFEAPHNIVTDADIMEHIGIGCESFGFNSAYNRLYKPLYAMLVQNKPPYFKSAYCGAHSTNLVFDPFGRIGACWDLMQDPRNIIGTVDERAAEFVFNDNYARWHRRTVDAMEDCAVCPYKLFCAGGCAAQALVVHGDLQKSFCDGFARRFEEVAVQIARSLL